MIVDATISVAAISVQQNWTHLKNLTSGHARHLPCHFESDVNPVQVATQDLLWPLAIESKRTKKNHSSTVVT